MLFDNICNELAKHYTNCETPTKIILIIIPRQIAYEKVNPWSVDHFFGDGFLCPGAGFKS
ncbi:hypothetical protein JCM18694_18840 [Prolixibacter denitrificans]|uniref:Uncharacterized protein n=1 Tax=Prolixibacter denitrificans TaxID=1541063 RepID=A0ABQ0ZJU5_9BACT|nr:hypothetical protein JCM18694_18840 [Prolixibacter denitrificans]